MSERACGNSACHLNREERMVPLEGGGCCDPCIEPIIRALNAAGIKTIASCCGHGFMHGSIVLADKRELIIARDFAEARRLDALARFDINGEPHLTQHKDTE